MFTRHPLSHDSVWLVFMKGKFVQCSIFSQIFFPNNFFSDECLIVFVLSEMNVLK